jgi:NADP-dependent 3-hydroxy acid dehydrogenase YdfG
MGRAVCAALVQRGNRVVLADRNADGVNALARELGPATYPFVLDVTDGAAVDSCVSRLPQEFTPIDVLVNNAGHDIGGRLRFDLGTPDDWSGILETNLIGLMRVTRAIVPGMVERNKGDIINMGSVSAVRIVPDTVPYSTSKAGVHMLSDIIRAEYAETAIRVTEIMPGLTKTGAIVARYRGDEAAAKRYYDSFKMALDPEDVARCIVFALDQPPQVQIAQLMVLPLNRY